MMSGSLSGSARNSSRSPFTPNQWQELEQQALVFKYMVTGTPIPPDLIFSIKRSLDSSISSRLFPHHPSGAVGYAYFQMGFGRKVDPEPGRCRRTDGKKWRCSKEAYPDSKYCERHMHRGRNRSRKPVEISSSSTTNTNTNTNNNTSSSQVMNHHHQSSYTVNCSNDSNNNNNNMASSTACSFSFNPSESQQQHQYFSQSYQNPFFYTQSTSSSSSSKHHDADFPPHDATTHHLFMDSGSYSHDQKDYRHIHGMREDVDERAFFPEASGSARSYLHDSYQHHHHHQQQQQHLSMGSYKNYSSNSHFQIMNNNSNNDDPRNQEQHCFVLGTDFKSTSKEKDNTEKTTSTTQQRPLHHFFGEWPPKNTDSWLDLASNSRIPSSDE
ncbi:hypothetical protein HN51_027515 [Arachis hypogaea]|uniref:Growth-regulating factor n=1 Tax=Arachis hypogaea TaxID=3818 RepID=A0A445BMR1_ARAHY|nr:growth-regulating factor 5 isoform X1 [Arachis hypogaea]QHO33898.1 Growth-regulating factor [Arachis hypogaea]RYR39954.1 hypothetical protein Ahy_A09g045598 [Arachis hypogaea]